MQNKQGSVARYCMIRAYFRMAYYRFKKCAASHKFSVLLKKNHFHFSRFGQDRISINAENINIAWIKQLSIAGRSTPSGYVQEQGVELSPHC